MAHHRAGFGGESMKCLSLNLGTAAARRWLHVRKTMVMSWPSFARRKHWMSLLLVVCSLLCAPPAQGDSVRDDEEILFYPSPGYRTVDGGWEIEISASVFERKPRRLSLPAFRKALGFDVDEMSAEEREIFTERALAFLRDNQRGKEVTIRIGERRYELGKTGANGRLSARLTLPAGDALNLPPTGGTLVPPFCFTASLPSSDSRVFAGEVHLLDAAGLSVISDIDDTIKVSEVTDHRVLLRNTFIKPFQPVSGMAQVYRAWATNAGAQFHYVSASPWQLYEPLAEFVRANEFPSGTFHLKEFRWKDRSFFQLFASPENYKMSVIEPLLKRFPHRRFVLVGDSGERDPEIYGQLARNHPDQIPRIFIRETGESRLNDARYQTAFEGLPADRWKVFGDPAEIRLSLP